EARVAGFGRRRRRRASQTYRGGRRSANASATSERDPPVCSFKITESDHATVGCETRRSPERRQRVEHHLNSVADPNRIWSARRWVQTGATEDDREYYACPA